MRCLYVTQHGNSALVRSLTETGFNPRVVTPQEVAWAREEGPFSVVVYEHAPGSERYFPDALAAQGAGTVVLAILSEDNHQLRAALLRAGADYCLTQPVSVFEVEAVLHSFFRRQGIGLSAAVPEITERPATHQAMPETAPLYWHQRSRQVTWQKKVLPLSEKEIALLQVLMRSRRAATDRQVIWRELWGRDQEFSPQAMEAAISRLRRKLAGCPVAIINLPGFGYRLSGYFEVR